MSKIRAEFYNNLIDRILDSKLEAETRLEEELVEKIFFAINTVVERQIAKKPRINRVSDDTEYMKCPQCRLTTALYSNMRPDYCPKCGQKLDLNEVE